MDRARRLHAGSPGGVVDVAATALITAHLVAVAVRLKPSTSSSRARLASGRDENARTVSKPWSACSAGISGCSAISGSSPLSSTASWCVRPSGSAKRRRRLVALGLDVLAGEALGPEVDRLRARDPPDDRVDHAGAGAARGGARVLEEGEVGSRAALLVGVEEVVDGRVVLVDGLLHQAQAEHARVEVDVAGGVAGDGVMWWIPSSFMAGDYCRRWPASEAERRSVSSGRQRMPK